MQSPWTRDGKVRAELVNITPEVSGKIIKVNISDNQQVKQGDLLFALDPTPFEIALSSIVGIDQPLMLRQFMRCLRYPAAI